MYIHSVSSIRVGIWTQHLAISSSTKGIPVEDNILFRRVIKRLLNPIILFIDSVVSETLLRCLRSYKMNGLVIQILLTGMYADIWIFLFRLNFFVLLVIIEVSANCLL